MEWTWLDAIIRLDLHGFRLIGVDLGGLAGIGRTHDAHASDVGQCCLAGGLAPRRGGALTETSHTWCARLWTGL